MNTANLVSFKLQDNNLADSCWMYTWAHLTENDPCLVTGGTKKTSQIVISDDEAYENLNFHSMCFNHLILIKLTGY